jgi:hypothetical protein
MKVATSVATAFLAIASAVSLGAGSASAFYNCGEANGWGVGVSDTVTCAFALNVARGLNPSSRGGEATFTAYSPTTGASYSVTCHDETLKSTFSVAFGCTVWSQNGGAVYLFQI